MKRLFEPVSDQKLRKLVQFTCGFFFLTLLIEAGALDDMTNSALVKEAFMAVTGILVCLSLCKTLFHAVLPALYIRYGSYVMACGYAMIFINSGVEQIRPASHMIL